MDPTPPGSRPAWAQELHRVTHDLRTPLASIAGYADLLHRKVYGDMSAPQARAVESIHRRTLELKQRLDGFADWLYLMTGEPLDEPAAVDVVALATGEAERQGWQLDAPAAGPEAFAIEGALGVALRELIDNAVAAGQGPVKLRVQTGDSCVIVEIEDDGAGPPEDLLAGRTKPEGGVARARGWLARMGGTLSFVPAAPRGTIARMSLPTPDPGSQAL